MEIADPWSPVIFKSSFVGTDFRAVIDRFERITQQIPGNAALEKDGGLSSVAYSKTTRDQPHLWEQLGAFREWSRDVLGEATRRWGIDGVPYRPSNSWINKHCRGAWTDEHNHKGPGFVLTYYLNAPANSGRILFRDPLEYHWGASYGMRGEGSRNLWYPVDIRTGDIVMFPAWLYHKTEASQSDEPRYVMSTNFDPVREGG
jgi:uncharacterized protein (TIGR02466 family)